MKYLHYIILLILLTSTISCSTVVTKYTYDEQDNAHPVERIRLRGIGKVEVNSKGYKMESKPWVKIPKLPKIELEQ